MQNDRNSKNTRECLYLHCEKMQKYIPRIRRKPSYLSLIKVGIFVALLLVLYFQLHAKSARAIFEIHISSWGALMLAVVLMPLNYWCDFQKWKRIKKFIHTTDKQLASAYLGGVTTAFLSPNGWGNFIGRWLFVSRKNRLTVFAATAYSNLSQLLPTLVFGCLSLGVWYPWSLSIQLIFYSIAVLVFIVYWLFPYLLKKVQINKKWYQRFQQERLLLQQLSWPFFVWSLLRYFVFAAQYMLCFRVFGVSDWWLLLKGVPLIYALTAFVPSLWSGKIVIRETAALTVFQTAPIATSVVIVASLLIWLINIALPTFISSFVLLIRKKTH